MIRKLKTYILATVLSLGLFAPVALPALAGTAAAANGIVSNLCTGVNNAANGTNSDGCGTAGEGGTTDLSSVASKVVNIFSVVVGIMAVIMIIYGGFRYITSGGASDGVSGAKNTLIYAIVGLVVVALAQIIVHYVINTTTTGVGNLQ